MRFFDFETQPDDIKDFKTPLLLAIQHCPDKLAILQRVVKANGLQVTLKEVSDTHFAVALKTGNVRVTYNEAFIKTRTFIKYLKRKTGAL